MKQQGRFRHLRRFIAFMLLATLTNLVSQVAWAGNLFSGPVNSPAGKYPWGLAAGDFNGDHTIDLAVTNNNAKPGTRTQVKVLLGEGNGLFQKPAGYSVGNTPLSVAVGDFNGDGKLDLAVANLLEPNGRPGKISVLLGNGDGTFQKQVTYKAVDELLHVAVGDFNGDGKPDLAVVGFSSSGKQAVLLGNGDGTFQPPIKVPAVHRASRVVIGDLNGDGKPDLVMASQDNKRAIITRLGNGDGTFGSGWSVRNPPSTAIALGDFNGDGKLDLAETSDKLRIWLGNGDGTFSAGSKYEGMQTPVAIVVSDFDGDGNLDIAVADQKSSDVNVFLGLGNGKFQQPLIFGLSPGAMPIDMVAADVNGDGKPDLVVTDHFNHVVSVLLNTGKR